MDPVSVREPAPSVVSVREPAAPVPLRGQVWTRNWRLCGSRKWGIQIVARTTVDLQTRRSGPETLLDEVEGRGREGFQQGAWGSGGAGESDGPRGGGKERRHLHRRCCWLQPQPRRVVARCKVAEFPKSFQEGGGELSCGRALQESTRPKRPVHARAGTTVHSASCCALHLGHSNKGRPDFALGGASQQIGAMMLARRETLTLVGKRIAAWATVNRVAVRAFSTPPPPPHHPLRQPGGSIGSDLVNGLKGLFTLPPNFRKYSK